MAIGMIEARLTSLDLLRIERVYSRFDISSGPEQGISMTMLSLQILHGKLYGYFTYPIGIILERKTESTTTGATESKSIVVFLLRILFGGGKAETSSETETSKR